MHTSLIIQAKKVGSSHIQLIKTLIVQNQRWSWTGLSKELCRLWKWRNAKGDLKDIACRSLLRKLDQLAHIALPPPKMISPNRYRHRPVEIINHGMSGISDNLKILRPIRCSPVNSDNSRLFESLLAKHHCLGYRQPVGGNLTCRVYDWRNRPAACFLFGSAAWKCEVRDRFIGWNFDAHRLDLQLIANNHRFLVLLWVKASHLVSHLLVGVCRRSSEDWLDKYARRIVMVETLVRKNRFEASSYRAANRINLGSTKGRSRTDRFSTMKVPLKDVSIYKSHAEAPGILAHEQ